nr:hypothetical protein [Tanacetum cinerariifolium]
MSRNYTLDEDTYPTFLRDVGTVADPTKVKVGEQVRAEVEAKLLDSTVGRGSADQVDSAANGGQEVETGIVMGVRIVVEENVVTDRPKPPRKKRQVAMDASGYSRSPKKLTGTTELLLRQPFVVNLLSATPEHEGGAPADSITGLNIRTIGAFERSAAVPLVITEAVVTSRAVNVPLVLEIGVKVTSSVRTSLFQDSDSTETMKADAQGPYYSAKQDLSMGSRELDSENLYQVFVLQYNVLNDSLLDDYDVSREFVDHLAPPVLFS